ncbi:hypothetical protein AB6E06_24875 [Vibrio splendidus]|uniref:hypothetical protein n=2 Tax=unclassified Vibrio TaxID=2614977 RepID=UPI00206622F5|nr:hypothetical protein [Vibrio sp. ED004]UPR59803.1 hypothetical protein ITG10_20845 [Vibrio sp. ED004]
MKSLFCTLITLSIVGCSVSNDERTTYIENSSPSLTVGTETNAVAQIVFDIQEQGSARQMLVVNFPSVPYKSEFDLCAESGLYKDLESVTTNKDGKTYPKYKDAKFDCNSSMTLQKGFNGGYKLDYNLIFLKGYNVADMKGYDKLLPESRHMANNSYSVTKIGAELIQSVMSEGTVKKAITVTATKLP